MSSPHNSSFNNSDNKQLVRRIVSNSNSPTDQWMARSGTPFISNNNNINTLLSDPNIRQFVNSIPFHTMATNQRLLSPHNYNNQNTPQNQLFISNSQMNANNSNVLPFYANHSSNYVSMETPIRGNYYELNNRPVYTNPGVNALNGNLDINLLKSIVDSTERRSSTDKKCESPEITHSSTLEEFGHELSKLTDEESNLKKKRNDVNKKIEELNEEIKELEAKKTFRDSLLNILKSFDKKEAEFERRKKKLAEKMTICGKSQSNVVTNNVKQSEVTQKVTENKKIEIHLKKSNNEKSFPTVDRTQHKRPINSSSNSSGIKKVKIDEEIRKETNKMAKSDTKSHEKVVVKKPVTKPLPKTSGGQSKKVNRIVRQTPTPVVTSGVKTSKPQKMVGSRSKILSDNTNDSSKTNKSCDRKVDDFKNAKNSNTSENAKNSNTSENAKNNKTSEMSHEKALTDSDNEIFDELLKCISDESISSNVCVPQISTDSVSNGDSLEKSGAIVESKQIDGNKEVDENTQKECAVNSNLNYQKINDRNESPINKEKNDKTCELIVKENMASNVAKSTKTIEIVELDDETDEDLEKIPDFVIKKEKIDGKKGSTGEESNSEKDEQRKKLKERANELVPKDFMVAMRIKINSPNESSDSCSDSSEEQSNAKTNEKDDKVFKTPSIPPIKKPKLKFKGYEPVEYPPTVQYSIGSFKAIAGPKSKTSKTIVVFLKPFKNYLFVTFMDTSVRRYHIIEKENILKYEGHEDYVRSLAIICSDTSDETFFLYTGCKNGKLRAFHGLTAQLIHCFQLSDEITCLEFCYSHVFAGLNNGNLCKIKLFHEISVNDNIENNDYIQSFVINAKKRVQVIKALATDSTQTKYESVLVITINKLRIINTLSHLQNEDRILFSLAGNFLNPTYVEIYGNHLFISSKMLSIKNEIDKKLTKRTKIMFFDLQKDWTPIREMEINKFVIFMSITNKELILTCHSGEIQCIDCEKLELKWIAYHSKNLTASVVIGERLITGNEEGFVDIIYLDQKMIDCDSCGMTYARQTDFKEHIKRDHPIEDQSNPNQSNQ